MRIRISHSVLAVLISAPVSLGQVTFERVIRVGDSIPGGCGTLLALNGAPSLEGDLIAFAAGDPNSGFLDGVYVADRTTGVVHGIADLSSPFPASTATFSIFAAPMVDQGAVYFWGATGDPFAAESQGIFSAREPTWSDLTLVVDNIHPSPCGGTVHTAISGLSYHEDGQHAYKSANDATYRSICRLNDATMIVDTATPIPGHPDTTFYNFTILSLDGGNIGFSGSDETSAVFGVYKYIDDLGILTTVADESTPIPNGAGTFTSVSDVAVDEFGRAAFIGTGGSGQGGVYVEHDGQLDTLVDNHSVLPNGESLAAFLDVSIADGIAVVQAYGTQGLGIFVGRLDDQCPAAPALHRILGTGDQLDGKIVQYPFVGPESCDNGAIAICVRFDDGTEGLYVGSGITVAPAGDFDADGDVDLDDYEQFAACLTGPDGTPSGCVEVDLDCDADVDLSDCRRFQQCFTGANPR